MLDQSTLSWIVLAIVSLLGGFFWRWVAKTDAEDTARQDAIDVAFKEHREREAFMLGEINSMKVMMAGKVTRDDMDKVFQKIEDLSNTVITALGHRS